MSRNDSKQIYLVAIVAIIAIISILILVKTSSNNYSFSKFFENIAGQASAALPTHCSNGIIDGGETSYDCGGGGCKLCANSVCTAASKCANNKCLGSPKKCSATCQYNILNRVCGEFCATKCSGNQPCAKNSDCISGRCTGNPKKCTAPAMSCTDGLRNQNEEGVDCGGPCAGNSALINNGYCYECLSDSGCQNGGACVGITCRTPTCSDNIKNGNEKDIDCGGPCDKCLFGQSCGNGTDCASNTCTGGRCAALAGASGCFNGINDGNEAGIDCGGSCAKCPNNVIVSATNLENAKRECQSNYALSTGQNLYRCNQLPTCHNGVKDGEEIDVDCGGSYCPKCDNGESCVVAGSNTLRYWECKSYSCDNTQKCVTKTATYCNPSERCTASYTGERSCPACNTGMSCRDYSDCMSNVCGSDNKCTPYISFCENGILDTSMGETGTDCGGSCSFCRSIVATCFDQWKNGDELGIDCRGSCPSLCADTQPCNSNTDCISNNCENVQGVNQCMSMPTCHDGRVTQANGETDYIKRLDEPSQCTTITCEECGRECNRCPENKRCNSDNDCDTTVGLYCEQQPDNRKICKPLPKCDDGRKNQDESDVDCGGPNCGDCPNDKVCSTNGDCLSGFCTPDTHICKTPTCSDNYQNQDESDVDCGGRCSARCGDSKKCADNQGNPHDEYCQSNICTLANDGIYRCVPLHCTNNIKDVGYGETDVDCGPPSSGCSRCIGGQGCGTVGSQIPEACATGTTCMANALRLLGNNDIGGGRICGIHSSCRDVQMDLSTCHNYNYYPLTEQSCRRHDMGYTCNSNSGYNPPRGNIIVVGYGPHGESPRVAGWACDPDDYSKPLQIKIYKLPGVNFAYWSPGNPKNYELVASVTANQNQPFQNSGFEPNIVAQYCGGYSNRYFNYLMTEEDLWNGVCGGGTCGWLSDPNPIDRLCHTTADCPSTCNCEDWPSNIKYASYAVDIGPNAGRPMRIRKDDFG